MLICLSCFAWDFLASATNIVPFRVSLPTLKTPQMCQHTLTHIPLACSVRVHLEDYSFSTAPKEKGGGALKLEGREGWALPGSSPPQAVPGACLPGFPLSPGTSGGPASTQPKKKKNLHLWTCKPRGWRSGVKARAAPSHRMAGALAASPSKDIFSAFLALFWLRNPSLNH